MKFLVAGLGNPGTEYTQTRHNVGFLAVEKLAAEANAAWSPGKHGLISEISHKGRSILLLKPTTYMNLSGKAVAFWLQQEKIKPQNLLVITDDIALPTGRLRLKLKGSDGGHNGLKSISQSLNTIEFPRLRIGVGNDFYPGQQVQYVLGNWKENEWPLIETAIEDATVAVKTFVFEGPGPAMTATNAKKNETGS